MAGEYRGLGGLGDDRAWRQAAAILTCLGTALVALGVLSILAGYPLAARDTRPLSSAADFVARLRELSLPLSAVAAALVAGGVAVLLARRRLRGPAATLELIVLGVAIELCIAAAGSRIAYASTGDVLPGVVAWASGGVAVVAAALLAARVRD